MPALDVSAWASGEVTWKEIYTLLHEQLKLPTLKLPGIKKGDKLPLLPHEEAKVDVRLEFFLAGGSEVGFQLEDGQGNIGLCIEVDINLGETPPPIFGVMTISRKGCFRLKTCFSSMGELQQVLSGGGDFSGKVTLEIFNSLRLDILKLLPQNENLLTIDVRDAEGWIPVRFFATFEAQISQPNPTNSGTDEKASIEAGLVLELEIGQEAVDNTVFKLGVQIPGLVQAQPPLQIAVNSIKSRFSLEAEKTENSQIDTQLEFSLGIQGYFHFRFPDLQPEMKPILAYLEKLPVFIKGAEGNLLDLEIPVAAELVVNIENTDAVSIQLLIQQPSIEIDLFSMLSRLAIGLPEPASRSGNKSIPLDTDIGFQFKGVALRLGRGNTTSTEQLALELVLGVTFGELAINGFFRISDRELKIGLKHMAIPIVMPLFPLSTGDFASSFSTKIDDKTRERQTKGIYHIIDAANFPINPHSELPVGQQKAAAAVKEMVTIVQDEIERLSGKDVGTRRTRLYAKIALMSQIFTLRGLLDDWNNAAFKEWLVKFVWAIEQITKPFQPKQDQTLTEEQGTVEDSLLEGKLSLCQKLSLVLEDLVLQIPFRDPRNLGIQGSAHLSGFEEPFDVLNKMRLSAGISATMIYFQFDAAGATIPFPDLGTPYKGGSLTIGEFRFGLGYTTRTFAFALAGELVLPEPLVDDLDTSDLIGVGVRLPVQSAFNFRLDLMPILLPKVVLIIPLIEVNIDLRKDFSPGIVDTKVCTPYWDGLQLIVQDIYHLSFKHFAYSLFCGPLPVQNITYDADFSIGNASSGFTLVIDDFHVYDSLAGKFPIPFVFYPAHPFCNNFCINLRLAGFSLNFDLQRPKPQLSPFALFELFALLCDPQYKVNPNGELANTLRATLRDAYIILPPNIRRLFPKIADRIAKPLEITINLATYIQIVQVVMKFVTPVAQKLFEAAGETITPAFKELQEEIKQLEALETLNLGSDSFNSKLLNETVDGIGGVLRDKYQAVSNLSKEEQRKALKQKLESILITAISSQANEIEQVIQQEIKKSIAQALNALPPELRKIRLEASFGGFEARAILLLITLEEAKNEFKRRGQSPQRRQLRHFVRLEKSDPIEALVKALPNPPKKRNIKRFYDPDDRRNNLFAGRDLSGFKPDVLDAITAIMPEAAKSNAVMIAAYVNVFNLQHYQFLGYLAEDGSFGMVTATKISPLKLNVAGINVELPLTINGRLKLSGQAQRKGVTGEISAEIVSTWNIIPSILSITIGSASSPGTLSLRSDGRFTLKGASSFKLFIGAIFFGGAELEISETHCFLNNGTFHHRVPNLYSLDLRTVQGRIGPDRHLELAGSGQLELSVLGLSLKNVQGTIDEQQVAIAANLDAGQYSLYGIPFSCPSMVWRGAINLKNPQQPELELQGSGSIQIFNSIQIDGTLTINIRQGIPTVSMSGRLFWQGQEWLNASFEFTRQLLTIKSQISFDCDLTPDKLPNLKIANLCVKVDLQNKFEVRTQGINVYVWGSVLVGLKSPGTDQSLPIAASSIKFDLRTRLTDKLKLVKLVSVKGFGPIHWNPDDLIPNLEFTYPSNPLIISIPKFHLDAGSLKTPPRIDAPNSVPIYLNYKPVTTISNVVTVIPDTRGDFTFWTPGEVSWEAGSKEWKDGSYTWNAGNPRNFSPPHLSITFPSLSLTLPNLTYKNTSYTVHTIYQASVDWSQVNIQGQGSPINIPRVGSLRLVDGNGNDLLANWKAPNIVREPDEQKPIPIPSGATLVWGKNKLTTLPILQVPSFDLYLIWNDADKRFDVQVG